MVDKSRKLGCAKQFPDCPENINAIDCDKCPFFPKEFRIDQETLILLNQDKEKDKIFKEKLVL